MGIKSFTINTSTGSISSNDVLPVKQYYVIRQDDQIQKGLYKRTAYNRPMVFRLEVHKSMPFTEPLQKFCFNLNRSDDESRDRHIFADCYDTWSTNAGKIRDCRNYISGEGVGKPDPKWANLVMGRNVVCGEEVVSDGSFGILNGVKCLMVETLNPDSLPSGITYKTHPHLIHHCNIINVASYNGLQKVLPFPQMGGKVKEPYMPVYYPLMSREKVYIPMWMLIKLPIGSKIPNPYNPEWG